MSALPTLTKSYSRAALPQFSVPELAPSSGSTNVSKTCSSDWMTTDDKRVQQQHQQQQQPPLTADPETTKLLGPEDVRERADKRALLKAETEEFVKTWEAERLASVNAGKEEMAMQVRHSNTVQTRPAAELKDSHGIGPMIKIVMEMLTNLVVSCSAACAGVD